MWASLLVQMVKNLPARWETWVQSLLLANPLGKGIATHSGILACIVPWTESPGQRSEAGYHPWGPQK